MISVFYWLIILFVLVIGGIGLVIFLIVLSIGWWLCVFPLLCYNNTVPFWLSKKNQVFTRSEYITNTFPKNTTQTNHELSIDNIRPNLVIKVSTHVIYSPATSTTDQKQSLVVFHGVGSSATLLISSSVQQLCDEGYNVYSIDLPGCGTSSTNYSLKYLTAEEILVFYRIFLVKLLNCLVFVTPPYVVAHSIGGFLILDAITHGCTHGCTHEVKTSSTNIINKYQTETECFCHSITGLVLISPAGLLPTLSEHGHL